MFNVFSFASNLQIEDMEEIHFRENVLSRIPNPNNKINIKKTEYEIFKTYYESIQKTMLLKIMNSRDETVKCKAKSIHIRMIGNICYRNMDFKDALMHYNTSIAFAPRNSAEFGLAIANRSAIFHNLKMYRECLTDINIILRSEYPENLLFKIYLRQSKCFLHLNQNSKVKVACQKTLKYLDKFKNSLKRDQIEDVRTNVKEILLKVGTTNDENIDEIFSKPSLKDGENRKLLNGSNAIELKYNFTQGRHIVAKKDIKVGDVLFVEEPYAATLENYLNCRYNYCSKCFLKTFSLIPCTKCVFYFYCSDYCRQIAWDEGHKWECKGKRIESLSLHMSLALNIIFKASRNGFKTDIQDESVYGNKEDNFPFINKLVTNKHKMSVQEMIKHCKITIWVMTYLNEMTDYFEWLYVQPNRPEGTRDELFIIVGGYFLKIHMELQTNVTPVVNKYIRGSKDLETLGFTINIVGVAQYISSAMLNHSCMPNTVDSFHNNVRVVRAIKNISKGSEILIDYLWNENISAEQKTKLLNELFYFTCTCPQCENITNDADKPWLCPKCNGRALSMSVGRKAKCDSCSNKFNLHNYKTIEENIKKHFVSFLIIPNNDSLEKMMKFMKKVYHKENINYELYFQIAFDYFLAMDNLSKCINICNSWIELLKKHNDIFKLHKVYCKLAVTLAKNTVVLKKNNSPDYQKFYDETKVALKKSAETLKYYVSPSNLKDFEDLILNYLKNENADFEDCLM